MDAALPETAVGTGGMVIGDSGLNVDPFLVEALQNSRHRLTSKLRFFFCLGSLIRVVKPYVLKLELIFVMWINKFEILLGGFI